MSVWINHDGGPCPVGEEARVKVQYECGATQTLFACVLTGESPDRDYWQTRDGINGIVAYRVVHA